MIIAGVAGFRVMSSLDRFPGSPLEISLSVKAWPESPDIVAFAVIGDAGTGGRNQFRVAHEMARTYRRQPFGLLLTTGDNVYYGDVTDRVEDVVAKPYKPLFDAGVEFRPSLGNHDLEDENGVAAILAALGLPGRYYHFAQGPVDFFALDSNQLDGDQLKWLAKGLNCSENEWQVVYLHHPQYSSGANGSDIELRTILEPILVAGGADIVFAGHDHNYERTTPQRGIVYVVTGGGSRTRSVGSSRLRKNRV